MYECHGCGGRHETLDSIPATPLKVRTIEELYRESDSITYSFPAVLHYDKEVGDEMVCDMIVLITESTVAIYSLAVPEEKWFASYKEEIGETQDKVSNMGVRCVRWHYSVTKQDITASNHGLMMENRAEPSTSTEQVVLWVSQLPDSFSR
jgi:hypothetical protein